MLTHRRAISLEAILKFALFFYVLAAPDGEAARRRAVRHPAGPKPPVLSFYGDGIGDNPNKPPRSLGLPARSFTFETWVWLEAFHPSEASTIFGLAGNQSGSINLTIAIQPDGKLTAATVDAGITTTTPFPTRRWTHIAVRSSTAEFALLLDGVVVRSTQPSPVSFPTGYIFLSEYLTASLRQMRLWRVALTDGDIRTLLREMPSASDPRLAAWWPMDDSARHGVSTRDIENHVPNGVPFHNRGPRARWVRQDVLEAGPHFGSRKVGELENPNPPLFIDFDRDSDLDVYSLQSMYTDFVPPFPYYQGDPPWPDRAFRNDGTGNFTDVTDEVLIGKRIQGYLCRSVFAEDFTGDGIKDVLITDAGPERDPGVFAPESIRVGTPQGTLVNESETRIGQKNTYDHRSAIGDLDGDGDLDVFSAGNYIPMFPMDHYGATVAYLNNGQGVFTVDDTRVPLEGFLFTSVALLDADLDGDLDAFLGDNGNQGHNKIALNNGSGSFTLAPSEWFSPHRQFPEHTCDYHPYPCRQAVHTLEPADFDRDGLLDLVVLNMDAYYPTETGVPVDQRRDMRHTLQLLLGNGDGTFRDASARVPTIWQVPSVIEGRELGSYDGFFTLIVSIDQNSDGWLDVLVGANGYSPASLHINHGSAGFEEAGDVLGGPPGHYLYDVGDIDADGDQDIVADNWILENLKPWNPNAFPQTNLRLRMSVTQGAALVQSIDVENTGAAQAQNVSVAIPLPHGYNWQSTEAQGVACTRDGHVIQCFRPLLAAGATWQIAIQSSREPNPAFLATHAVASVTGDIRDADLSDNFRRISLGTAIP